MKIKLIAPRRWNSLINLETKYKESFLKKLSVKDSLKIFLSLYRLGQKLSDKNYHKKLNLEKIRNLSKVHLIFMKVGRWTP